MADVLDHNVIEELTDIPVRCMVYDETDSTNTRMKENIYAGRDEYDLIVADSQKMGRGRMGRTFDSPKGTGVYMSLRIHVGDGGGNILLVTSAAAVAVVRAVRKLTVLKPGIKWVNDIYIDGRKVCGILAEAVSAPDAGLVVILGVGINVTTPDDMFSAGTDKVAGALFNPCGDSNGGMENAVSRNELIACVVNEFNAIYGCIEEREYMDDYRKYSIVIGRPVRFLMDGCWTDGHAVDIDDDGGLIVETDEGTVTLNTGEITLRINNG